MRERLTTNSLAFLRCVPMNIDAINFQYNIASFNLQIKQKEYFLFVFLATFRLVTKDY